MSVVSVLAGVSTVTAGDPEVSPVWAAAVEKEGVDRVELGERGLWGTVGGGGSVVVLAAVLFKGMVPDTGPPAV